MPATSAISRLVGRLIAPAIVSGSVPIYPTRLILLPYPVSGESLTAEPQWLLVEGASMPRTLTRHAVVIAP